MGELTKWLGRISNATKSEDVYVAQDVILSLFMDKEERIRELEAEKADE